MNTSNILCYGHMHRGGISHILSSCSLCNTLVVFDTIKEYNNWNNICKQCVIKAKKKKLERILNK